MNCDVCGVKINANGFIGGEIVCKMCARAQRVGDDETIEERKAKYGGNNE